LRELKFSIQTDKIDEVLALFENDQWKPTEGASLEIESREEIPGAFLPEYIIVFAMKVTEAVAVKVLADLIYSRIQINGSYALRTFDEVIASKKELENYLKKLIMRGTK